MKILKILLALIAIILVFSNLGAANLISEWQSYEYHNFIIVYPEGYEMQAEKTLYYLTKYKPKIDKITGNDVEQRVYVLLQDVGLKSNGYANPIQMKINLYTTQPLTNSVLSGYKSWLREVGVHEYTHISQLTNSRGGAEVATNIFGQQFSPNLHVPNMITEGIAVYTESQFNPQIGRLNQGYYDLLIARKAARNKLPTLSQANYLHPYFPKGQWYLYGGAFIRYLANTYGEDSLQDFFNEYASYYWAGFFYLGDIFPALGIDKAAQEIYGQSLPELFQEWRSYERQKEQNGRLQGKKLVKNYHGQINQLTLTDNKLYYWQSKETNPYLFKYNRWWELIEYNLLTQEEKKLDYSLKPNHASLEVIDNHIYYTVEDSERKFSNLDSGGSGVSATLYKQNLRTGTIEKIITDDFRDFSLLKDGTVIYAKGLETNLGSEIWRYKAGEKEKIGTISELVSEIDTVEDKLVVVSKEELGAYGIKYLHTEPQLSLETIIDSKYLESGININNNKIIFNANYGAGKVLYQYDLSTGELNRLTANAFEGVINNHSLYYTSLFAEGMGIYQREYEKTTVELPPQEEVINQVPDSIENAIEQNNNLWSQNLKKLAQPSVRFLPQLAAGEDILGVNSYALNYSPYGGLDFFFNSQMLLPLTFGYAKRASDESRKPFLYSFIPLYSAGYRQEKQILLDYYTNFSEDIMPGLRVQLSHPNYESSLYLQGDINQRGLNTELSHIRYIGDNSLELRGSYYNSFATDLYLGGFDFEDLAEGYYFRTKYNHKLFKIRDGIWNPNIFVGDIYGSLFVDYIRERKIDFREEVYGAELSFESGVANFINIAPKIGISSCNGEIEEYFQLSIQF